MHVRKICEGCAKDGWSRLIHFLCLDILVQQAVGIAIAVLKWWTTLGKIQRINPLSVCALLVHTV